MSNTNTNDNAVSRLASQSSAIGRLAQDTGGFAAAVAAFESRDTNAFRWVLERVEMLPYCELICEWIRIKLCVLRCAEICGPFGEKAATPNLQQFARAVVQLSSNEELLRRAVDAVACGDGRDYRAVLEQLKLGEFCHLLCYWICSVGYRRICELVCSPQPVIVADAVSDLRAAGESLAGVIRNEKAFDAIAKAAIAFNCQTLQSAINQAGLASRCEIICLLICVWRCAWVCRELCELPPRILTGVDAIEEAQSFALAGRQLAGQHRILGDLVNAVQNRNAQAYREIIDRFRLGPYCWQVCAWVCSVTCYEFCICVCPPLVDQPWFTTVGDFHIYSDIDATSGLTNKSLPPTPSLVFGGGPNFAFFEQLQLGGFCPSFSPTSPGTPMQYRFLYSTASTTLAGAIDAAVTTIHVAGGVTTPPTPFNVSVCTPGETGETMTVTGVAGTTWTVIRGQEGTSGVLAAAGATLWINPRPITGSLITPWQVGQRSITWPQDIAGVAGALGTTFQTVYVYSAPFVPPPETAPPVAGAAWFGPSIHYIAADPVTGWIPVDPNALGGGFQILLGFDTTQPGAAPGGAPIAGAFGTPGGVPAGSVVPALNQRTGTDLTIIFQATRVGVATADYSNSLCKIHVNNWSEVNNLWFLEFGTDCCTPIDGTVSVQFTVDHEEMKSGGWSLAITSCSPSAPGNITPPAPPAPPTAGVTFTPGGRGAWGTITENTSTWNNCSYTAALTTRPGLTTGLLDRTAAENLLTFCICGHGKH